jgi:hypothetical protein
MRGNLSAHRCAWAVDVSPASARWSKLSTNAAPAQIASLTPTDPRSTRSRARVGIVEEALPNAVDNVGTRPLFPLGCSVRPSSTASIKQGRTALVSDVRAFLHIAPRLPSGAKGSVPLPQDLWWDMTSPAHPCECPVANLARRPSLRKDFRLWSVAILRRSIGARARLPRLPSTFRRTAGSVTTNGARSIPSCTARVRATEPRHLSALRDTREIEALNPLQSGPMKPKLRE